MAETYELKLQPQFFNYIKYGTKRIELRLYDEKRQKIKAGDEIIFLKEPSLDEKLKVKVVKLIKCKSFEELIEKFEISILADKSMTKSELLMKLEKFYTKENQKKYGVVGIRLELV